MSESSDASQSLPHVPLEDSFRPDAISVVLHIPDMNVHPMQTRSKSGVIRQKACFTASTNASVFDFSLIEPTGYKVALKSPVWLAAMQEEIDALKSQDTWQLVILPPHKNLVGCKWIFKIKKHADGFVARHKARLVAQGFSQELALIMGRRLVQWLSLPLLGLSWLLQLILGGCYNNWMLKMHSFMVF